VHPDYAARVIGEASKMLANPNTINFAELDHRIIRRDRIIRTVEVRITVELNREGQIINC